MVNLSSETFWCAMEREREKRWNLGMTILHHAVDSKNLETVAVVVKHLNQENDESIRRFEMNREVGANKWTPLYRAGEKPIKHLREKRGNNLFLSFFLPVVLDCSKEIIETLLRNGANANCEDKSTGTTALQMAVIRGNVATSQLLVNHGANTRALSKVNETLICSFDFSVSASGWRQDSPRFSRINEPNGKSNSPRMVERRTRSLGHHELRRILIPWCEKLSSNGLNDPCAIHFSFCLYARVWVCECECTKPFLFLSICKTIILI